MTKHEIRTHTTAELLKAGVSVIDAMALRRIALTFHRWDELACGDDRGCIVVEDDGRAYWQSSWGGRPQRIPNREAGAYMGEIADMLDGMGVRAAHQMTVYDRGGRDVTAECWDAAASAES